MYLLRQRPSIDDDIGGMISVGVGEYAGFHPITAGWNGHPGW
jgi:hypothetical protein